MSVCIHWRPTSDHGKSFEFGTSDELAVLVKMIGGTIRPDDIKTLRAMAMAAGSSFYNEVADIVEQVGDIEVWGEW